MYALLPPDRNLPVRFSNPESRFVFGALHHLAAWCVIPKPV
jgi:hypothetical protein